MVKWAWILLAGALLLSFRQGAETPEEARKLESELDWIRAEAAYTMIIETAPDDPEGWKGRGRARSGLYRHDEAIADLTEAIRLNGSDAEARTDLALALMKKGVVASTQEEYRLAIREAEEAIRIDPGCGRGYVIRGVLNFWTSGSGEMKEAQYQDVRKGVRMASEDPFAHSYFAIFASGFLKDDDLALRHYARAIELDPKCALAYAQRGNLKLGMHDHSGCEEDLTKALEIDPDYPFPRHYRGVNYYNTGDYSKALRDLDHAVSLGRVRASLHGILGRTLYELGDEAAALKAFKKSIELDHGCASDFRTMGYWYWKRNMRSYPVHKYVPAAEPEKDSPDDLNRLLDSPVQPVTVNVNDVVDYGKAVECYSKSLELEPDHWPTRVDRGNANRLRRKYKEAISDYDWALGRNPKSAHVLTWKGEALEGMKKRDEAMALYNRAIESNPRYVPAYLARGVLFEKTKDLVKAREDYKKVQEIDPDNEYVAFRLEILDWDEGKVTPSVERWTKLIEINPRNYAAFMNRGIDHSRAGEHEKAIRDYSRAIEIKNDFVAARRARAEGRFRLGDYVGSMEDGEWLHSRKKGALRRVLFVYGNALFMGGKHERALEIADQAVQRFPKEIDFLVWRTTMKIEMGEFEKALHDIEKGKELHPSRTTDLDYCRGLVLAAQEKPKEALDLFLAIPEGTIAFSHAVAMASECCRRLGDIEKATELSESSLIYSPMGTDAWHWRAVLLSDQGKNKEALKLLEMYLFHSFCFWRRAEALALKERLQEEMGATVEGPMLSEEERDPGDK